MKIPPHILFVCLVVLGIFLLGIGLTYPLWMLTLGYNPVEAINGGTNVVVMSVGGLVILIVLGAALQSLRKK